MILAILILIGILLLGLSIFAIIKILKYLKK